jgi:hypothetical protein
VREAVPESRDATSGSYSRTVQPALLEEQSRHGVWKSWCVVSPLIYLSSLTGFADVVHAVVYSLLLLNTDLHVVESTSRMTAKQFVRNTMNTIQLQEDETPRRNHSRRPSTAPSREDDESLVDSRSSFDRFRPHSSRSGSITHWNGSSRDQALASTPNLHGMSSSPSKAFETPTKNPSTQSLQHSATTPIFGRDVVSPTRERWRESELESLLRVSVLLEPRNRSWR